MFSIYNFSFSSSPLSLLLSVMFIMLVNSGDDTFPCVLVVFWLRPQLNTERSPSAGFVICEIPMLTLYVYFPLTHNMQTNILILLLLLEYIQTHEHIRYLYVLFRFGNMNIEWVWLHIMCAVYLLVYAWWNIVRERISFHFLYDMVNV